jgi:hypothetical protein
LRRQNRDEIKTLSRSVEAAAYCSGVRKSSRRLTDPTRTIDMLDNPMRFERPFCRFTVAMSLTSAHSTWPKPRVPLRAQRWILGTLAMSAVFWLVALAGVLALANRVHHDIPALLAAKLLS